MSPLSECIYPSLIAFDHLNMMESPKESEDQAWLVERFLIY